MRSNENFVLLLLSLRYFCQKQGKNNIDSTTERAVGGLGGATMLLKVRQQWIRWASVEEWVGGCLQQWCQRNEPRRENSRQLSLQWLLCASCLVTRNASALLRPLNEVYVRAWSRSQVLNPLQTFHCWFIAASQLLLDGGTRGWLPTPLLSQL